MGDANIAAMSTQPRNWQARLRLLSIALAAFACMALLGGCEFFIPPPEEPPDPATDGLLSCGETMSVDGLPAGSEIPLDLPLYSSVLVLMDFTDSQQIGRLRIESETTLQRALAVWDPVQQRTVIPGYRGSDEELRLELLGADPETGFSGSVSAECSDPGEVCFNLTDDDGDGAIDCADLHCARDVRCVEDQHDLDELVLSCGTDFEDLEPPELRSFDDPRTLYTTPGGERQEFWGGAELLLGAATGSGTVEVLFGEAGMACIGSAQDELVPCSAALDVTAGETRSFPTVDLPVRLEPLASAWLSLEARLVCD